MVKRLDRQAVVWHDAVFNGRGMQRVYLVEYTGGVVTAIAHAHACATDQIFMTVFHDVVCQTRPQLGDRGAIAVTGIDAGASDFRHAAAQML